MSATLEIRKLVKRFGGLVATNVRLVTSPREKQYARRVSDYA